MYPSSSRHFRRAGAGPELRPARRGGGAPAQRGGAARAEAARGRRGGASRAPRRPPGGLPLPPRGGAAGRGGRSYGGARVPGQCPRLRLHRGHHEAQQVLRRDARDGAFRGRPLRGGSEMLVRGAGRPLPAVPLGLLGGGRVRGARRRHRLRLLRRHRGRAARPRRPPPRYGGGRAIIINSYYY